MSWPSMSSLKSCPSSQPPSVKFTTKSNCTRLSSLSCAWPSPTACLRSRTPGHIIDQLTYSSTEPYSPYCLEGEFSEVPLFGIPGSPYPASCISALPEPRGSLLTASGGPSYGPIVPSVVVAFARTPHLVAGYAPSRDPLLYSRTADRTEGGRVSGRWVDLRKAAEMLGTSTEAVRKRASRGSLRSDRNDGRVVVWVDKDRAEGGGGAEVDGGPVVEILTDQVAYLRSQLDQEREATRENRRIIAALTQRIPELEAPASPEPPGASESVVEEPERAEPRSATGGAQEGAERPWSRRKFGG